MISVCLQAATAVNKHLAQAHQLNHHVDCYHGEVKSVRLNSQILYSRWGIFCCLVVKYVVVFAEWNSSTINYVTTQQHWFVCPRLFKAVSAFCRSICTDRWLKFRYAWCLFALQSLIFFRLIAIFSLTVACFRWKKKSKWMLSKSCIACCYRIWASTLLHCSRFFWRLHLRIRCAIIVSRCYSLETIICWILVGCFAL